MTWWIGGEARSRGERRRMLFRQNVDVRTACSPSRPHHRRAGKWSRAVARWSRRGCVACGLCNALGFESDL
jgi:hypothetical protein